MIRSKRRKEYRLLKNAARGPFTRNDYQTLSRVNSARLLYDRRTRINRHLTVQRDTLSVSNNIIFYVFKNRIACVL